MALTTEALGEVLELGHELRHVEFKRAGDREERDFVATVARAVMAMGNLPDGGHVVLGVAEVNGRPDPTGLSPAQLAQWLNRDEVLDAMGRYSDPTPEIGLHVVDIRGVSVVDIQVDPFVDTPYLCRRDYPGILQVGRMYVRRVGKAETADPTHHELREVIDRAASQRVRTLLRALGPENVMSLQSSPPAGALYKEERDAVVADSDRMAFETAGNWDVKIYPVDYQSDRLERNELLAVLESATVRISGWPVPFISTDRLLHGVRYIGGELDTARHVEAWRFYRSGQFHQRRVLSAELPPRGRGSQAFVDIWEVILHTAELYIFAARLAESLRGVPSMTVDLALDGVIDAQLRSEPERGLQRTYTTDELRIEVARTLPVADLLARPRELALEVARELLEGFGLSIGPEVLSDYQRQLLDPSSSSG